MENLENPNSANPNSNSNSNSNSTPVFSSVFSSPPLSFRPERVENLDEDLEDLDENKNNKKKFTPRPCPGCLKEISKVQDWTKKYFCCRSCSHQLNFAKRLGNDKFNVLDIKILREEGALVWDFSKKKWDLSSFTFEKISRIVLSLNFKLGFLSPSAAPFSPILENQNRNENSSSPSSSSFFPSSSPSSPSSSSFFLLIEKSWVEGETTSSPRKFYKILNFKIVVCFVPESEDKGIGCFYQDEEHFEKLEKNATWEGYGSDRNQYIKKYPLRPIDSSFSIISFSQLQKNIYYFYKLEFEQSFLSSLSKFWIRDGPNPIMVSFFALSLGLDVEAHCARVSPFLEFSRPIIRGTSTAMAGDSFMVCRGLHVDLDAGITSFATKEGKDARFYQVTEEEGKKATKSHFDLLCQILPGHARNMQERMQKLGTLSTFGGVWPQMAISENFFNICHKDGDDSTFGEAALAFGTWMDFFPSEKEKEIVEMLEEEDLPEKEKKKLEKSYQKIVAAPRKERRKNEKKKVKKAQEEEEEEKEREKRKRRRNRRKEEKEEEEGEEEKTENKKAKVERKIVGGLFVAPSFLFAFEIQHGLSICFDAVSPHCTSRTKTLVKGAKRIGAANYCPKKLMVAAEKELEDLIESIRKRFESFPLFAAEKK